MLDALNSADLDDINNIEGIYSGLKATADAAKHYYNFFGIVNKMDGQV